jgi:hypothetical protein
VPAGKERDVTSISACMRPMSLGWFFVAVWAIVCVLLAVAIMAVTVLA